MKQTYKSPVWKQIDKWTKGNTKTITKKIKISPKGYDEWKKELDNDTNSSDTYGKYAYNIYDHNYDNKSQTLSLTMGDPLDI